MIIWTLAVLSVLYACVLYFCICTCSEQLSMFYMERRSRNTLIMMMMMMMMMVIIIIIITLSHNSRECGTLWNTYAPTGVTDFKAKLQRDYISWCRLVNKRGVPLILVCWMWHWRKEEGVWMIENGQEETCRELGWSVQILHTNHSFLYQSGFFFGSIAINWNSSCEFMHSDLFNSAKLHANLSNQLCLSVHPSCMAKTKRWVIQQKSLKNSDVPWRTHLQICQVFLNCLCTVCMFTYVYTCVLSHMYRCIYVHTKNHWYYLTCAWWNDSIHVIVFPGATHSQDNWWDETVCLQTTTPPGLSTVVSHSWVLCIPVLCKHMHDEKRVPFW